MKDTMNIIYDNWEKENDIDCIEEVNAFRDALEKVKGIIDVDFMVSVLKSYDEAFETSRRKAFIAGFTYATESY